VHEDHEQYRRPLSTERYTELGVWPMDRFPLAEQERINETCAQPEPPSRWLGGEFVRLPSRAHFEWYVRRGREPREEREHIPAAVRRLVFKRDNGACRYCGASLTMKTMHVDHVHPVSRGGSSATTNLVASCRDCNLSKGAKTPEEWLS
jgi:hypothetical protein